MATEKQELVTQAQLLINDLESVGLKLRGQSKEGLFQTYQDKLGRIKVKFHPPDSTTKYSHMHIYDSKGNSLTGELQISSKYSPDVHLEIEPIEKELQWSYRK